MVNRYRTPFEETGYQCFSLRTLFLKSIYQQCVCIPVFQCLILLLQKSWKNCFQKTKSYRPRRPQRSNSGFRIKRQKTVFGRFLCYFFQVANKNLQMHWKFLILLPGSFFFLSVVPTMVHFSFSFLILYLQMFFHFSIIFFCLFILISFTVYLFSSFFILTSCVNGWPYQNSKYDSLYIVPILQSLLKQAAD